MPPSLTWAESRQMQTPSWDLRGIKPGTGRCCRRRPLKILTWTRENRLTQLLPEAARFGSQARMHFWPRPGTSLAPPARPPSGPITSRVAPGSHVGEVSPFPQVCAARRLLPPLQQPLRSGRSTLTRLRTLGKRNWTPPRSAALLLCRAYGGRQGRAVAVAPGNGEAGGGGGGLGGRMVSVRALGPSRSWSVACFLAQGRALRLKTGGPDWRSA